MPVDAQHGGVVAELGRGRRQHRGLERLHHLAGGGSAEPVRTDRRPVSGSSTCGARISAEPAADAGRRLLRPRDRCPAAVPFDPDEAGRNRGPRLRCRVARLTPGETLRRVSVVPRGSQRRSCVGSARTPAPSPAPRRARRIARRCRPAHPRSAPRTVLVGSRALWAQSNPTAGAGPGEPDNDEQEDDATVVGAYLGEFPEGLTRDALAEALHWTLDRLERALAALDVGLRASGLRLRANGRGVSLAGRLERTDGLTRASIERLAERAPILTRALARLTWDAMGSGIGEMRPEDRDAARVAEHQGLIYGRQGRLRLTWPVVFSLCLKANHGWLWADGPWDQQPPTFRPC